MSGTVSRTVKVGSLDMPMIGFGTYMIKDEDCEEPVKWALERMGKIQKGIRLPLVDLDEQFHQPVLEALVHAGVNVGIQ